MSRMVAGGRGPISDALRSLRSALLGTALLSLPINVLMLTGPLFMLQVYDRVLASGSVPTLLVLGCLAGAMYVFYGLLEGIRSRVLLRIGQRLDAQLSNHAYETAVQLPYGRTAPGRLGDPVRDLESVRQFLSGAGPSAICDLPWMPVYLGLIFLFHPLLGLVALGGAVIMCLLIGLNEWTSRQPLAETSRFTIQRDALVAAGRRNSEAIAAMGMLEALQRRWSRFNRIYLEKQRDAADRGLFYATAIKTCRFVLQSAILGVGAWLAIGHSISAGVMIAATILTTRALSPVEQAVTHWRGFVVARQGLTRLSETIGQRSNEPERTELPAPNRSLSVNNLFAGPSGQPLLHGINFTLAAGAGLGVIGPSGAGKTALARTLVGVYPVLRGSFRLDGADLNQWAPARRGAFIGYLPQDIQLFAGTVAQNIARFDPAMEPQAVIEAARLADAHDLITALPDGFDTQIGPDVAGLSGGQMQRIALARALYGSPFLVVLDEPNSNLDAEGEAALTHAIETMRGKGSIVIVIAHRPSALAALDTVLFMREGRAHAFGPKDEVLRQVVAPVPRRAA